MVNKLKEIRMGKFFMTSRQFAEKLGIAEQQYQRYESGKVAPSLEIAIKISKTISIPVEEIWQIN